MPRIYDLTPVNHEEVRNPTGIVHPQSEGDAAATGYADLANNVSKLSQTVYSVAQKAEEDATRFRQTDYKNKAEDLMNHAQAYAGQSTDPMGADKEERFNDFFNKQAKAQFGKDASDPQFNQILEAHRVAGVGAILRQQPKDMTDGLKRMVNENLITSVGSVNDNPSLYQEKIKDFTDQINKSQWTYNEGEKPEVIKSARAAIYTAAIKGAASRGTSVGFKQAFDILHEASSDLGDDASKLREHIVSEQRSSINWHNELENHSEVNMERNLKKQRQLTVSNLFGLVSAYQDSGKNPLDLIPVIKEQVADANLDPSYANKIIKSIPNWKLGSILSGNTDYSAINSDIEKIRNSDPSSIRSVMDNMGTKYSPKVAQSLMRFANVRAATESHPKSNQIIAAHDTLIDNTKDIFPEPKRFEMQTKLYDDVLSSGKDPTDAAYDIMAKEAKSEAKKKNPNSLSVINNINAHVDSKSLAMIEGDVKQAVIKLKQNGQVKAAIDTIGAYNKRMKLLNLSGQLNERR